MAEKIAVMMMDGADFQTIYDNHREETAWGAIETLHISTEINWSIILTGETPATVGVDYTSKRQTHELKYQNISEYSVLNKIDSVGAYILPYKNITGTDEVFEFSEDLFSLDLDNPNKTALDYETREVLNEAYKVTDKVQSVAKSHLANDDIRVAFIYNLFTDLLNHKYCNGAADELIQYAVDDILEVVDRVLLISDHRVTPRRDTRQAPAKHQTPAEYCIYPTEKENRPIQIEDTHKLIQNICEK